MLLNTILEAFFFLIIMSIAAELISRSAEILEYQFGAGFVGSVILGFITTFPELLFVIIAVLSYEYDVAMGSAIGGNILLFTIGYGLVIVLAYVFHRQYIDLRNVHIKDDLWYLLISCILILIFAATGSVFDWWEGLILILIYFIYILHQFREARQFRIILVNNSNFSEKDAFSQKLIRKDWIKSGLLVIVGGLLLLISAEPFVHSIGKLSNELGISALFLALVISPLASELPEKISAFILTTRDIKGAEMSVANFIGSKVQNNSLLFGLMIIIAAWFLGDPITDTSKDILLLLIMTLTTILGVKLTYDLRLNTREGVYAIIMYVLAILLVFVINLS